MNDWIPVRETERLDEAKEFDWVQVQTQDGTVYPATYKNNQWVPLFRGGTVEHLMHGKVAYWLPRATGYPYVQCKCGQFYLQAEGRKTCPVCASFGIDMTKEEKPKKPRKPKEEPKEEIVEPVEELPFDEPPTDDLADMLI